MRFITIIISLCIFVAGSAQSAVVKDESVVLIRMSFENGQWRAMPLEILPCGAPSKPDPLTRQRSAFQLMDGKNRVLFRRHITNPRIILVEDPKEEAELLSELEFTLAVPLVEGAALFQYFEHERDYRKDPRGREEQPTVATADLSEVIADFEKRRHRERAPCQIIQPKPEDPRKLGKAIDTAISVETITSMIARDQHLLIQQGLERNLDPEELRQLIYSYKDQWADVRVNNEDVEMFLDRYTAAFRESAKHR